MFQVDNTHNLVISLNISYGYEAKLLKRWDISDEIYYNVDWLIASLNSTVHFLFLELGSRTGLGEGLLDLTVYEVQDTNLISLDDEKIYFDNFNNREINNIYKECGLDNSEPFNNQQPNPLPDRKALDDIVFDVIGLTEEERKEVYWAVCELVQRRLEKAKSV